LKLERHSFGPDVKKATPPVFRRVLPVARVKEVVSLRVATFGFQSTPREGSPALFAWFGPAA
jgi:hypothetical protein